MEHENLPNTASSLLIDVMDIWGRLIPGVLWIVLGVAYHVDPFGLRDLWSYLLASDSPSVIETIFFGEKVIDPFVLVLRLSVVGMAALLFGEIPVTLTLKFRDWILALLNGLVESRILREDASEEKLMREYFQKECGGVFPKQSPRSTFHLCKYALAIAAPASFKLLRTYEARLNLYAGCLGPAVLGGGYLIYQDPTLKWAIITAVVVGFLLACIWGYSIREIIVAEQSYYLMHNAKTPTPEPEPSSTESAPR